MEQGLAEQMQAWRKAHPRATLYEIEKELDEQIAVMRAQLLADTAAAGEVMEAEVGNACPVCGAQLVKDGRRKRKLKSTGGQEVELERQYMHCAQCGYGFFPLDKALGLLPGQ